MSTFYFRSTALLVAAMIVFPYAVRAERYYVSSGGNDASGGAYDQPWRTLQHAADTVSPGDEVITLPGDYAGFDLQQSGTTGAPITFLGTPGAIITSANARTPDGINLELASHVVVDGFEVTGAARAGVRSVGLADAPASHVSIRNIHAHDNGRWGIFTGFVDDLLIEHNQTTGSDDEHGIYVSNSGDRPIVRNNVVWGNSASGIQINSDATVGGDGIISGAVVEANRIYNNGTAGGSAINLDGVQDSRIVNNLLYDNHASGISLYGIDGAQGASGNLVAHNTIVQASDGRWALNIQDGSTNNTVRNNILLSEHSFRGSVDISAGSLPGFSSNANAVIDRFTTNGGNTVLSLTQWRNTTSQDADTSIADESLFLDVDNDVFSLAPGSVAVDAGEPLPSVTFDLDGRVRNVGTSVDIGAFEWRPGGIHAADFNANGRVGGGDLLDALLHFGARFGTSLGHGDATGDGAVSRADLAIWQSAALANAAGTRAVPEPNALLLMIVVFLFFAGHRASR